MIKITKIVDNFKGTVPVMIQEGYTKKIDKFPEMPKVGECFSFGSLLTTEVISLDIVEEGYIQFKTLNSTYRITY